MIYCLPSITVLLIFACLVAYEYIRDLRRDLKEAKSQSDTWRSLYENADRELRTLKGLPLPTERMFTEDQQAESPRRQQGFQPGEIGRRAILTRDFGQRDDDQIRRRPSNTPSLDEIAAAADAAVNHANNGDGLD